MNRRALLISGASSVAGLGLMRLHLARAERRLAGGAPTEILALREDLPTGARISDNHLTTRALPESYLESRHIPARRRNEVLDTRLGVDVRAGEALLWTDLQVLRERTRQLAELVPEGMRAVAIHSRGLDELLRPGDRVDVLATAAQAGHSGTDAAGTRAVAQNVLVLAVGTDLGAPGERATSSSGGRVTLSVTPEQARRLAEVERGHELRLVLRNPDDLSLSDDTSGAAAILAERGER